MTPPLHIDRLVIVGVGLIGGSLALSLKQAGIVKTVVGLGKTPQSLTRALELGVIDEIASSPQQALAGADVVVLCIPVAQTLSALLELAPWLEPQTLVSDAGSTKQDVVLAAKTALGDAVAQFIPAHPIAGREQHGVEAALADLYTHKKVVLCPLQENPCAAVARIQTMWEAAGAHCHRMSAIQHDAVFAAVSHLPHVLSYALMTQIVNADDAPLKFEFAGSGFRDFTRIAASNPEMWRDICLANREAILRELATQQRILVHLKTLIENTDGDGLEKMFRRASEARLKWAADQSR